MFIAFGFKNRTKKGYFQRPCMGRVPKKSCQQTAAGRGKFKGHLHVTSALWKPWDRLRKVASWGHLFHDESKNVGGQTLGTGLHHTAFSGPAGSWMLHTRKWKVQEQLWHLCPLPGVLGIEATLILEPATGEKEVLLMRPSFAPRVQIAVRKLVISYQGRQSQG